MFTAGLVFSLLPVLIVAQYGGPIPLPTTSAAVPVPSAPPDTSGHKNVDVAFQGSFTFHPANLTAPNNTQVTFWFPDIPNLDHSVTQSSFEAPCTHLAAAGNNSAGFDSGLQHAVTFTITITDDTQPIWFHCKQITHCGLGMVGSINAPATGNNYDAFLQAAKNIGSSEVTENDSGPVTGGVNAIATAPPASSTGGSNSGSNDSGSNNSGTSDSGTNDSNCNYLYNIPLASFVGSLALVMLMT